MTPISERWETRSLPLRPDGRSYVSAEMAIDQPQIREMVQRTIEAWDQPLNQDAWVSMEPGEITVRYCVREWEWIE